MKDIMSYLIQAEELGLHTYILTVKCMKMLYILLMHQMQNLKLCNYSYVVEYNKR